MEREITSPGQVERSDPLAENATLVLVFTAIISMIIYAWSFTRIAFLPDVFRFPMLTGEQISLHVIDKDTGLARAQLILSFVALAILYYFAWKAAHHAKDWVDWAVVLTAALAFGLALLYMYPFGAADVFDNILHGRITSLYGGNPFVNVGNQYPGDLFLPYTAWRYDVSAYGPLWELPAAPLAKLAGNSIPTAILLFKLLPAFFWVLSIGVIGLILKRRQPAGGGSTLPAMLLFAWNPLVLYEVWGNAHNDMMMAFFILLAGWLLLEKHYSLAVVSLVAGALVKYIPILLVPIVGLIALNELTSNRRRALFIISSTLMSAALIAGSFKPFWVGLKTLSLGRRSEMLSGTLGSAIHIALVESPAHLDKLATAHTITTLLAVLTLLFAIFQGFYAMRKPNFDSYVQSSFNVLMFYLLVTVPWFQQWYAIWPLVLLPFLAPMARNLALVLGFSVLGKQLWVDPMLFWRLPVQWSPNPGREIAFSIANIVFTWLYAAYTLHLLWQLSGYPALQRLRASVFSRNRPIPTSFEAVGIPVTGEAEEKSEAKFEQFEDA